MGLGEDRGRDIEKCQAMHEMHRYYGESGNRPEEC